MYIFSCTWNRRVLGLYVQQTCVHAIDLFACNAPVNVFECVYKFACKYIFLYLSKCLRVRICLRAFEVVGSESRISFFGVDL